VTFGNIFNKLVYVVVPALPLNAIYKVVRRQVREQILAAQLTREPG
jgi:hypothetical protein